jgi:glycosyltransferase involved in cell wall biosynthesis
MDRSFSIIVPVYDRPDELSELLGSLSVQSYRNFEVIIVEDGSRIKSEGIVEKFKSDLNLVYLDLPHSGPSVARNEGMKVSRGDFLMFIDSDCLVPENYLTTVNRFLEENTLDLFGGPDKASEDFNRVQKAISYAMTSFLTTGGIRGGKKQVDRFHPRSFNMGISRKAYESTGGFPITRMHPGEDMVFTIELIKRGFKSGLISCAHVFHKRRTNFRKFFKQVRGFGYTRHIISRVYPETFKLFFLFPTAFSVGLLLLAIGAAVLSPWLISPLAVWAILIFSDSFLKNHSVGIGLLSVWASLIQLCGYGYGFLIALIESRILGRDRFGVFKKGFYPVQSGDPIRRN